MMKTWLKGGLIGLGICFLIYLPLLIISAKITLNDPARKLYYERFELCEQCGMPRDLDCVIELCKDFVTEEYEENPPKNTPGIYYSLEEALEFKCSKHPDLESGCKDCFVNGFCGYSQYPGFYYGKEPTFANSLFNFRTFQNAFRYTPIRGISMSWIFLIIIIISSLIGLIIGKQKVKKQTK